MQKLLILFLSIFWYNAISQNSKSSLSKRECENKAFRDSLISEYILKKAKNISYNDPDYQLYCDSILMICPNVSYAYQQKSMPYMKGGDYQNGMKYLNKAVEIEPKQYTDYRAFMKCIFTKDYKGAIIDFNKSEQFNPNRFVMDHSYPFHRGLCYLALKNYKLAEKEFLKDIYIQTKNDSTITAHFNTYLYIGILYFEMKQFDKAEIYLNKSLLQYQDLPETNYYLGLTLEAQNKANATEFIINAKNAALNGYTMNEDNLIYANYPHQITLYEIEKKLSIMKN